MHIKILTFKRVAPILMLLLVCWYGIRSVFAQTSASVLYVPLIGITSVPEPLALPKGAGVVTYHYAVKNFLSEIALTDIHVVDDACSPVIFITGDDNGDSKLDYSETWRYSCTMQLSKTTESTATATGTAYTITATDKAYATVVVGSSNPPPLVSIVNITKVAYPLSLPAGGGAITFTYKVNNPGIVPLRDVTVADDKCSAMSGKLGDTNGNNILDIYEVWIYTCVATLTQTTTNTVTVKAFANGLQAMDSYTLTVKVEKPTVLDVNAGSAIQVSPDFPDQPIPSFPETGQHLNVKNTVWGILSSALVVLTMLFVVTRNSRDRNSKKIKSLRKREKQ